VDPRPIRTLSLCTGIGGLDLGIDLALGGRCCPVALVEREAFAAAHLVSAMEAGIMAPAPIHADLATFPTQSVAGSIDLILGGYPCQPFSQIGFRHGTDDPRHLWPHILRIIRTTHAPLAFFENVRGHLTLGFDQVLADLADLGFDAEWTVLPASRVGATHRRDRLFILAYRPGQLTTLGDALLPRLEGLPRHGDHPPFGQEPSGPPAPPSLPLFPPAPLNHDGWARWLRLHPDTQPSIRRGPYGIPDRVDRLRALGNAVVPLQAAVAFRTLTTRALGATP
jgi:DNA (cytosine-5)-methyltransferase 1